MRLFGEDVLRRACRKHPGLAARLDEWAIVVYQSDWRSLAEVRRVYPSADGVKSRRGLIVTVFNVKGNTYRMLTLINYAVQALEVLDVLTHAEYSKGAWKEKY